ncbi:MAG: PAS domain S-box protein, partial [Gammaproteobacteria bacterium]|nr:PAS domain S-box protein [Gammaproteobacteria bacterium]
MKNKNIIPPNIEMFQEFLNGIISPIAYLDTECNFILVNQAYANADNKTPEFFPGLNHFDLYPDQDNQKIFQSVIDKGEPYKCTARPFEYADHPERETSYWDWELNPIKDTNDNINGVVLSLIDVTERINIEKEQAHNLLIQEIVASIIELSLQPLPFKEFLRQALVFALQANKFDLALQGVIFLLNPESGELEMCVRHGLPDSIVSSCSTVTRGECICGKALEQEKLIFTSCVDHQHSVTYEGMSSHGHYCIPIKSQGEILGVLNLYVEHGHKSNRVEEQFVNTIADTLAVAILRERTSKALKESEKRFRAITETANDAIISINTDGKIISWNRGAKSIFGYEYEDIINHPLSAIIPEKYQKLFKRKMRLWNKTGKIQHTNIPMEASGLRMDGTEMALEILFSNWTLEGKEYTTGIVRDITKRKQTERLSQENEKKFKAILEASPIPLALNNDQGNITYINKAFVQATGYTTQDIPHLTDWWPLAYPDPEYRQLVIEIWTTHLEHAKETNSKFTPIEINVSCKNGSTRTFIASAASLDNNFFDNHLVVLYDITERKQTENALSDSYNLLQTIIDTAPVRIFWKDKQLRYLGCNPALSKDAGELSPQDIIGKSDFQLNWKNQAELYQSDDYNVMKTNTAKLSYVEPQTTPEGNTLWRRTSKVPLINAENETIGILGIYQDITEQKKIETELQIAATAFEANVGIMVTDTNGTIVKINKAFTEQSGYSSEETLGQTPSLFKSGRHDKGFYAAMWDSIKNKGVWSGEIWDRRKNGEIYPKWLNITAIKAADGSVTHFVSTQNDITELKISENEIKTLAFYDSLTSLPNRRLLQDRLQQALASSE